MHAIKQGYAFGTIRTNYFQRTTRVFNTIACHHPPESVGHLEERFLKRIFPASSNAHDHFVIVQIGKQKVKIFRRCLQIGIHITDEL